MAVTQRVDVSPVVIRWARDTANLTPSEAAHRMGVRAERVLAWESGDLDPTLNQLKKAADVYSRPLGALLMEAPPEDEYILELPDFRSPESLDIKSKALTNAIHAARQRIEALDELVSEGFELPARRKQLELGGDMSSEMAGAVLRDFANLSEQSFKAAREPRVALRRLIENVQQVGIIVNQVQRVDVSEMRGFSMLGENVATVVINSADSPRGKVFTILHELAHIGRRGGAICDLSRNNQSLEERFCDAAASAALMPRESFGPLAHKVNPRVYEDLRNLADEFSAGVSAESALLRMVNLGITSWEVYEEVRPDFRAAYRKFRADQKGGGEGGAPPIYYQLMVRDLGKPLIWSVTRAHQDGLISSRDTAKLLGVNYEKIEKLVATARLENAL